MPVADSRQPLRRQWHLLSILPEHGNGLTSRELNERLRDQGFKVDKRTTERDLQLLEELALVQSQGTNPCRWLRPANSRWQQGMTTAEALGLSLLEQQLKPLLPASLFNVLDAQFAKARQLLDADKSYNSFAPLIDKIRIIPPCFLLQPPKIELSTLEAVQQAVANEIPLKIRYQGLKDDKAKLRIVMPIGLLQEAQITYLIGRDPGSNQNKLFALHRMQSTEILHGEAMDDISDFNMDSYLAEGYGQFYTDEILHLHAIIGDDLAKILLETPLSKTMQIKKNKSSTWEIIDNLPNTSLLRRWLSSQEIKVINNCICTKSVRESQMESI